MCSCRVGPQAVAHSLDSANSNPHLLLHIGLQVRGSISSDAHACMHAVHAAAHRAATPGPRMHTHLHTLMRAPVCVQTFAVTVALPTTIAVVMLLAWHIRMVASNKTTIEHAEVHRTSCLLACAGCARVAWLCCTTRLCVPRAAPQGVTAQIKAAAGLADRQRHPYDLGCHANVEQILGDDALTWCLPRWHGTPGGLSYASAFDASGLGF